MVYRIVHAFKRFAVQAALRSMPLGDKGVSDPEPRIRSVGPEGIFDEFLFGPVASKVSAASDMLGSELSRISGKVGELRQLLADLARVEPAGTVEVNAVAGQNYCWAEDVLFDGDAFDVPALPVLSLEGDADFLFEDEPARPGWRVFDTPSAGLHHI